MASPFRFSIDDRDIVVSRWPVGVIVRFRCGPGANMRAARESMQRAVEDAWQDAVVHRAHVEIGVYEVDGSYVPYLVGPDGRIAAK